MVEYRLSPKISDEEIHSKNKTIYTLAKKLDSVLAGYGLGEHTAQVALVLDASGSMSDLYRSGAVQTLVERMIPFALRWDDNGVIDTWLFSNTVSECYSLTLDNLPGAISRMTQGYHMGSTNYAAAFKAVFNHYKFNTSNLYDAYDASDIYPTYLIFVTDGAPDSRSAAITSVEEASRYPLFIQFVAIGEDWPPGNDVSVGATATETRTTIKTPGRIGRFFGAKPTTVTQTLSTTPKTMGMKFLVELDEELNTNIDACNAFAVQNPATVDEDRLYRLMTREYPLWLPKARSFGYIV
jgi:hypothetical protein